MLSYTVRCYNKIELGQLLAKAVQFVNSKNLTSGRPNFYPCSYLYRTKTPDYFQTIASDYDNIMKPYIKDNNGDPLSPINGRINGLFFSANVSFDDNQPVPKSPYGNRRFVVQIKAFELNSPETRLYFGDFYCRNGGYSDTHHVTLVLTKAGTAADTFCQRHLVELSKIDNPFFKIKTSVYSSETEAQVTGSGAWVEILYTQNVDINDWENIRRLAYFTNVTWSGRVGAALKTVGCSTCSLNVSN
jgi:hypothetical protein